MTSRARLFLTTLHPAAFAAGYVLLSFANLPTPAMGLWRPLAIAIGGALILSIGLGLLVRNRPLGAMLATAVILAVSAWWLLLAVVVIALTWIGLVSILRRRRKAASLAWPGWESANRAVGVFGTMFAVVTVISAAPAILESLQLRIPERSGTVEHADGPNIYLIMLDGYPRSDVLNEYLGFDNTEFEDELTRLGFAIPTENSSNYSATWATLASMFHGEYLDEIDALTPFAADQTEQLRSLMRALNQGTILGDLRERGYRLITVPSPMELATLTTADEIASGGHMTAFELSLLQHSQLLGPIMALAPDYLWDQQRERIEHALRKTVEVAQRQTTSPTFMFTHLMSPHAPIVFGPSGGNADAPPCFPADCTPWEMQHASQWDALPGQVEHLNELVKETATRITEADPTGVIVIFSDHGLGLPGATEPIKLSNFIAIRSPEHPGLMDDAAHPVDLLPSILNAYLGTDLPLHEYRGWLSAGEHPLQLTEVMPLR